MKSLRHLVLALAMACAPITARAASTTNLGIAYPMVGADADAWGTIVNSAFQSFDNEWKVETLADASLTAASTTRIVRLTTAFTAARTITLPAATTHTASQPIIVLDVAGSVGATNTLTFARAGADTIESPGASAGTSYVVTAPRRAVILRSDGTSKWIVQADLGTIAKQDASAVAITGGSVTGITDLAVADGGTGSSTATAARTALGLAIGTDVEAYNANLAAIAGLTSAADKLPYFTGSGTAAVTAFTSYGRSLVDDADAATARTTLGLGTAATQATGTSGANVPLLNGANTWSTTQTLTAAPVFTDASGSRTALGLGTAATQATGTSGATLCLLNASCTFSGTTVSFTGDTALGDANADTATVTGHLNLSGTAPTLSSCGTSPSFGNASTDHHGRVVTGSGTVTSCTVTFSRAFSGAPACTISGFGDTGALSLASLTTTALVVNIGIAAVSFEYLCLD
jgi:hypothetical protein